MRIQLASHLEALTERIIGAGVAVSRSLGHGFLEAVYRKAMLLELAACGVDGEAEKTFDIRYRDQFIGHYIADLVVEGTVIVELKAVESISQAHVGQVVNYLKASGLPVGLLLNFGRPRLEIRRVLP
jgi:GxxExxY protein